MSVRFTTSGHGTYITVPSIDSGSKRDTPATEPCGQHARHFGSERCARRDPGGGLLRRPSTVAIGAWRFLLPHALAASFPLVTMAGVMFNDTFVLTEVDMVPDGKDSTRRVKDKKFDKGALASGRP